MEELIQAYRQGWEKPDRRPIWEWARENVYLPSSAFAIEGWFNVEISPYLKYPFQLLQDDMVRQINVLKAVQTFGSGTWEIGLQYLFANDPGPTMCVFQTDDDADEHFRTRIEPVFQVSPGNKDLYRQMKAKRALKKFPHMDLYINGANLSSLQRKSIKYLFNDENWDWTPGMYGEAIGRTEAFPFNCKIVNTSQAGIEGDEWDEVWNNGQRHMLGIRCQKCGHLQEYNFFGSMLDDPEERAGIVWNPEARRKDGTWDKERAANSAAFKCCKCGHEHPDESKSWDRFNKSMEHINLDPDRPRRNISLQWPMLVRGVWGKYVDEYLTACEMRDRGSIEALKKFYQKKLVKPWKEDMGVERIELRTLDYQKGDPAPEGWFTFLTADYQEGKKGASEHFWYVVRAWSKEGASRLIDEGKVDTDVDLYEIQEKYGIESPCVCVDGGDRLLYIAGICAKYGWTVLEGSHRESFPHKLKKKKHPVFRAYSPRRTVDPGRGTRTAGRRRAFSFMWSNPTVKDILYRLRHGRGVDWDLPMDISKQYEHQIDSEVKEQITHPKTGAVGHIWKQYKEDNHLWDCECEQVVCALILGVITSDVDDAEEEEPPPPPKKEKRPRRRSVRAPHEDAQQMELMTT